MLTFPSPAPTVTTMSTQSRKATNTSSAARPTETHYQPSRLPMHPAPSLSLEPESSPTDPTTTQSNTFLAPPPTKTTFSTWVMTSLTPPASTFTIWKNQL